MVILQGRLGRFGEELCHFGVCQLLDRHLDPSDDLFRSGDLKEVAVLADPTGGEL